LQGQNNGITMVDYRTVGQQALELQVIPPSRPILGEDGDCEVMRKFLSAMITNEEYLEEEGEPLDVEEEEVDDGLDPLIEAEDGCR